MRASVEAFDQLHANALAELRTADTFFLVAHSPGRPTAAARCAVRDETGDLARGFLHFVREQVDQALATLEAEQ